MFCYNLFCVILCVGERPRRISLEESYTEEYAVNRHCGLCGIPVSNIVLSLMEKGAKVISYGRGGDFMSADGKKVNKHQTKNITHANMNKGIKLVIHTCVFCAQSYEMKPNFHATVVDYDFEEDEYIVKAGSHNIRVPQNKLLRYKHFLFTHTNALTDKVTIRITKHQTLLQ